MLEGPIGAAAFNNEFGRPNLTGYFRTYEQQVGAGERSARLSQADHDRRRCWQHPGRAVVQGRNLPGGTLLIQLGGPGMLIGLGGGAASSMTTGSNTEDLDFASVQRGNPEIQRRAQEVIDRCWQMGAERRCVAARRRQSDPVGA
jgi:phosphoribosylformylglycinamidine synthase